MFINFYNKGNFLKKESYIKCGNQKILREDNFEQKIFANFGVYSIFDINNRV